MYTVHFMYLRVQTHITAERQNCSTEPGLGPQYSPSYFSCILESWVPWGFSLHYVPCGLLFFVLFCPIFFQGTECSQAVPYFSGSRNCSIRRPLFVSSATSLAPHPQRHPETFYPYLVLILSSGHFPFLAPRDIPNPPPNRRTHQVGS